VISVYLNGRLGNNLFQYAFCRIASIKQNCNFFIPNNKEESISFYTDCSQKTSNYFEMSCESNPHYWTGERLFNIDYGINDGHIDTSVGDIDIENVIDGTLLIDFYQSDSYLLEYRDVILNDWYKFNESIVLESKELLDKYNVDEYCYIHLRGTDYKTIPQYFLPIDYYLNAIKHIKEINSNIKFLVITDDIEESKQMFPEFEVISNSTDIDFYLISKSKYKIIPNSSFSWWASWLSQENKITIAPNKWFNYNIGGDFSPPKIETTFFTYL
jgi:hypothetical protein